MRDLRPLRQRLRTLFDTAAADPHGAVVVVNEELRTFRALPRISDRHGAPHLHFEAAEDGLVHWLAVAALMGLVMFVCDGHAVDGSFSVRETIFSSEKGLAMEQPTFVPAATYREPKAAADWLTRAFGFEVTMAIEGPEDAPNMCHYELAIDGRGRIMIGGEWSEWTRSPASIGGVTTQNTHVALSGDLDGHCARARDAGATIAAEPEDQFYGDRTYRAVDLEGHLWTFSAHIRDVTKAEAEAAIGQRIEATSWA